VVGQVERSRRPGRQRDDDQRPRPFRTQVPHRQQQGQRSGADRERAQARARNLADGVDELLDVTAVPAVDAEQLGRLLNDDPERETEDEAAEDGLGEKVRDPAHPKNPQGRVDGRGGDRQRGRPLGSLVGADRRRPDERGDHRGRNGGHGRARALHHLAPGPEHGVGDQRREGRVEPVLDRDAGDRGVGEALRDQQRPDRESGDGVVLDPAAAVVRQPLEDRDVSGDARGDPRITHWAGANSKPLDRTMPESTIADRFASMAITARETDRVAPRGATPDERAALGKSRRKDVPRASHRDWRPALDRPDPVDVLERQASERVPELVSLRYARMLTSPFAFYRGAAAIMAGDLASTPSSGLEVQACGDAHLANFGAYAAPDRTLVFDINDFDETHRGPWEWDVKRLAASFEVGTRELGLDEDERRTIVLAACDGYRVAMHAYSELGNLDLWHLRDVVDIEAIQRAHTVAKSDRKALMKSVDKALAKDRMRALAKLTRRVDGRLRFVSDPPLIVPIEELVPGRHEVPPAETQVLIDGYRKSLTPDRRTLLDGYRFAHLARKVVGVGSVGTRAWVVLLIGRDEGDPLFLQVKEADRSVLEPYTRPARFGHQGRRVVEGQRVTQAATDILLGWMTAHGLDDKDHEFYVRQLWDEKGSVAIETMSPYAIEIYARACGRTLARAHARTGDPIAIAAYLGNSDRFDRAIAAFASDYADQNQADYEALVTAAAQGEVAAADDPLM
jgi:uncharacterized protein (DUF2252 family)